MKSIPRFYLLLIVLLCSVHTSFGQVPLWGFNIGSTTNEVGYACKTGPNGNTCITGYFSGTMDLDPGPGVYNITCSGDNDIFVACYSPSGAFLWGFGIGGVDYESGYNMAIDAANNVYICGAFQGAGIDFDPGPGITTLGYAGGFGLPYEGDGFIAKYSSTGLFQWAKDLGGPTVYDFSWGLATDELGNVYVGGEFNTTMVVSGSITLNSTAAGTAYIIKYDPLGNVIWAHNFGEFGTAAVDCAVMTIKVQHGNIYCGGTFRGTANFDPWGPAAMLTAPGGGGDFEGFLAKYDTAGNFIFVKQVSGTGIDYVGSLDLDASDNIYLSGWSSSPSITFTGIAPITAPGGGGNYDIYMAKYNSIGVYQWGHMLGGSGDDYSRYVDVSNGYLYSTGQFFNTVDMDPSGAVANLVSTGDADIFLTKYDLDGNYVCGFSVGSPATQDEGYGLTHNDSGDIFITGQFGGSLVDFDPSTGTLPLTSNGAWDAYLVKYRYAGSGAISGYLTGDTICNGQTAQLTVIITAGGPGPFTITITDGTTIYTITGVMSGVPFTLPVSPSVTTTYTLLTITPVGASICSPPSTGSFGTAVITVNTAIANASDSLIGCNTWRFTEADGDFTFRWNFGDGTTSVSSPVMHFYTTPGNYDVILTDSVSAGCVARDTLHITAVAPPVVNLGPDITICNGTSVTLQSPNTYTGATYLWSTGASAASIDVSASGIYWLMVSIQDCIATDTVNVTFGTTPVVNLGNDTSVCPGKPVTLSYPLLPGYQYTWSTGSIDNEIQVDRAGQYSLMVEINGCKAADTINIFELPTPSVRLGQDTDLCQGEQIVLNATDVIGTLIWNSGQTGESITASITGTYYVRATTVCGSVTDSVHLTFEPCDIFFPSAFTPNGDGLNDIIRVVGYLHMYKGFSLSIYNRWGQLVFYSEDIYRGWDGYFQGVRQDLGTYFYMIFYTLEDKQHMMKGDFELIR